jgi:hypothetical protein
VEKLTSSYLKEYLDEWIESLHTINSSSGQGRNKLRTYRTFKFSYETATSITSILPNKNRADSICKVSMWGSPHWYERLALNQRICLICKTEIEDEKHIILYWPRYEYISKDLFAKVENVNEQSFSLSDDN